VSRVALCSSARLPGFRCARLCVSAPYCPAGRASVAHGLDRVGLAPVLPAPVGVRLCARGVVGLCPGICSRVCHCPAGSARARFLLASRALARFVARYCGEPVPRAARSYAFDGGGPLRIRRV